MSKIARIYQGTNEIQKYYQGGVLQRLFFDWKHYIGNELNIEYAKECAGRNVVISGKTYQNLLKPINSTNWSGESCEITDNYIKLIQSGYTEDIRTSCDLLKSGTKYTLVYNVKNHTLSSKAFVLKGGMEGKFIVNNNITLPMAIGLNRFTFTTSSTKANVSLFSLGITSGSPDGEYIELSDIILLEGDYTNTDLPTSINGIESAGEGEFVKSKNLYNKKFMNRTMTANGEVVDSRGFTFTLNDECTFKINGTNTTGCTIMSENILDLLEDGKSYILSTNLLYFMATITYNDDTPQKWTSVFTVNKSVMNSIKLYNQWKDTDIVSYNNFVVKNQIEEGTTATEYEPFYEYYPITIRNYNYKCETDNIILPNGVKNSIDTIDGKKVHVRRVGKIVLDATNANNFKQVNTMQVFRWDYFFNTTSFVSGICDKFPIKNVVTLADENRGIRLSGNNFKCLDIKFPDDTGFNINTFRTWLSENPVTVGYELATPIYTYLESGIYDDITIPTSGIKNEIYSENGKWYHKRNIGKVIFDGSSDENWNYYNKDSIQRFDIKMPNEAKMYNVRTPVYTEGYQFEASKNEDKIIFISGVETVNKLYIYNYAYTSVKDFRSYLTKNPLEVYYELAEPVISELYFSDITYKLNEPLRSLPNGVCDTIEENKLIQRVEKVVLDGSNTTLFSHTLDTQNSLTTTVRFYITVSSSIFNCVDNTVDSNNIFMANFPLRNGAHGDYEYIAVQVMSASSIYRIFLNINRDKLESVDVGGLKKWLEQTPITIYYPLANPIETEITPDKIPPFLLKEGLTTLKSTNNITPQMELDCLVRDEFQNMCPNTWVNGDIAVDSGVEYSSSTSRIKLQDYIAVQPNTTYYCDTFSETVYSTAGKIGVRYYKNDKTYISGGGIGVAKTSYNKFTTPEDCYYIKFIVETLDTNYKMYLRPVK